MIFLIPQTLDRAADKFPEREAVRFYDRSLTYAELVGQANSLAHSLVEEGVKRGDRVGIYMNKGVESAVSIYGIMKAGAAYVPLDASAPIARLAAIIRDCGIHLLVTHKHKQKAIERLLEATPELTCIIGLDASVTSIRSVAWSEVYNAPSEQPDDIGTIEQDLAYIIYTSGSTGTPKGIMHTHYSGLSYAKCVASMYGMHHEDRLTNHAPLHFDMSTFDFVAAAVSCATTVIVPEEYMKLPASYSKLMADEKISVFFIVPFALTQLLLRGELQNRDLSALRWIIFGGEPSATKHIRALMARLPHTRFSHMYGPAETNGCTKYNITMLPTSDAPIPIGAAFVNMESLVVDEYDREVEPGQTGELLMRGPTLMQGYWGRPALNARVFLRRPVHADFDKVFYRTGDLVQVLTDGHLRFIGRKDRQVKVRGYRVELDELEDKLLSYENVEEAAVFLVEEEDENKRIDAAVLLRKGASTTPSELILHLKSRLPGYAVPSKVNILDDFPRTPTGKIDRGKLQEQARAIQ